MERDAPETKDGAEVVLIPQFHNITHWQAAAAVSFRMLQIEHRKDFFQEVLAMLFIPIGHHLDTGIFLPNIM